MLKLFHKNIDTGTGLMTPVILCIIKHGPEFCSPQFCSWFIANFLKKRIISGIILLI